MVGPDLASAKRLTAEQLDAAMQRMSTTVGGLSAAEIESLKKYILSPPSTATPAKEPIPAPSLKSQSADAPLNTTEGSAVSGKQLFFGSRAFKNGGMACNACHSVNAEGSMLGPDLSNISTKMSRPALIAACEKTPFKIMKAAYEKKPLLRQEAADIATYLTNVSAESKVKQEEKKPISVELLGAVGAAAVLIVIAIGYRHRNSSVRNKLQRR